jgi:DNA-binding transcriptional LysR family regulator
MDLNEAAVFVRVVQAGSFSAAARQLELPVSTVSTRVARLEKRLGLTLLQRTTRRLRLTEAGDLYYQHASAGLAHMLDAEAAVTASTREPRGLLRVTAPSDFGDAIMARLISGLRRDYPKVNVELMLTDRAVDLVAEGMDVAIRAGVLQDSTLVAKRIGVVCWALFASPDYLRKAPPLTRPEGLCKHNCLQFAPLGKDHWSLAAGKRSVVVPMAGQVLVNDFGVIRTMALAGEGIALLPTYVARAETDGGRLVRLLSEWRARADPVHLVYPRQRFVPPKLRVFVDQAAQELKRWLD